MVSLRHLVLYHCTQINSQLLLHLLVFTLLLLSTSGCALIGPNPIDKYNYNSRRSMEPDSVGIRRIVQVAKRYVGVPYQAGGESTQGIDCSGLTRVVYREALGLELPHKSSEQASRGTGIRRSELCPGDLIFFGNKGWFGGKDINHVGIYLGNNYIVHASHSNGVTVASLSQDYLAKHYRTARRLFGRRYAH
ncbi:hypothetical protein DSUL_160042 [Desulfovibrionales bacterium]